MSVTRETHQSAMGPYVAMAAAASESYSVTAVFRSALLVKVWQVGGGERGGGDGEGGEGDGGGEGEGDGGEGDGGGGEGDGGKGEGGDGEGEGEGDGGLGDGGGGLGDSGLGDGGGGEGDGGGLLGFPKQIFHPASAPLPSACHSIGEPLGTTPIGESDDETMKQTIKKQHNKQ